jgi:Tetratricopeptide repeat/Cytochrome c554 and c-prime
VLWLSHYYFFFPLLAFSAEAGYVGSQTCGACHADKLKTQSATGHAHALAVAPSGSPGYWAFGAGAKAITYVSQAEPEVYVEHGRTYYAAPKTMAPTPGHKSTEDVRYPTFDPVGSITRCFRCHSTGQPTLGPGYAIQPAETGVQCEACHGPGSAHASSGGAPGTIRNPKQFNAVELNEYCGVCHRKPPEAGEENDWSNAWNIRHQPAYLGEAACFRKSIGKLSCLTCHDPHSPLNQTAAAYDQRCAACHHGVRHGSPVTSQSCIQCHMPQVSPTPQLAFTNHWIGIYAKGKNLVPVRRTGKPVPRSASPGANAIVAPNDPSTLRPLYEQVLTDRLKEFGPEHAQVARSASGLGLFLKAINQPEAAEAPLRRALAIDQANDDPLLPADQENLAMVLDAAGRRAEARELFRQAAVEANPAVAARSLASLAAIDPERAREYYTQALQAEETASGANHRRVAILLNNLAMTLVQSNGGKSAEPLLRRALEIQQKTPGARHVETAATLINLGSVLQDQKQFAEAERLDRLALSILEEKSPESRGVGYRLYQSCGFAVYQGGPRRSRATLPTRAIPRRIHLRTGRPGSCRRPDESRRAASGQG